MQSILIRPVVRQLDTSAMAGASALAGAAFLAFAMLFTPEPAWMPVQREASLFVVGRGAVASFSFSLFCLGLAVHFAWSFVVASAIDSFVRFFRVGPAIVLGAALGLALYLFDAVILVAWAPWFAAADGIAMVAAHVVFGMIAAGAYEGIEDRHAAQ
jgi:hypothetical protein